MLYDLISLFFPHLCPACDEPLTAGEPFICSHCIGDLPLTDHHQNRENSLAKKLWGRFPFEGAWAFLYFKKESIVQTLLHKLKYENRPDIGELLGERHGGLLNEILIDQKPDYIVPVPLHDAKKRKRGYNQSDHYAIGLSKVLQVPVEKVSLQRFKKSETQTRKNRIERIENVSNVFQITRNNPFAGKHILLTDDVATTGATLESCALALLEAGAEKISVATIAEAY